MRNYGPATGPRTAPRVVERAVPARQRRILQQLEQDREDFAPVLAEMFRVAFRLNAVNVQVHQVIEALEGLRDGMERDEICTIVEGAIQSIDLSHAVADLQGADEEFRELASQVFTELESDLLTSLPSIASYISPPLETAERGAHAAEAVWAALRSEHDLLADIQREYMQLLEFLPRYQSIMRRSTLFDVVVGFAAGFFGGELGKVGVELWEGWRQQDDEQFLSSFAAALDAFLHQSVAFTERTEAALEPAVSQILTDLEEVNTIIASTTEGFAAAGGDLAPYLRKTREVDEPLDDDNRAFLELVLDNLRSAGFTGRAERNVREVLGM